MTPLDGLVLAWVVVSALLGARRGFVSQALSLAGFAAGALVGSRLAPHLLAGGASSSWTPLAGLAGGIAGGVLFQALAGMLAARAAPWLRSGPLRVLDGLGGLAAGAVLGLALAWLAAVTLIGLPGAGLRGDVRRSAILTGLIHLVPPDSVLRALARYDPLPVLPALPQALPAPDVARSATPAVRRAARLVVKVQGTACGLAIEGSGWPAGRGIVATNAHVVAGEDDTHVVTAAGTTLDATPVYVDADADVALLRVPGLRERPLRIARSHRQGEPVTLVGYPENGPLRAVAGRAGSDTAVIASIAGSRRIGPRTVVPLRGLLLHGDSGGPALDRRGRVVAMMFAAQRGGGGGYGVPTHDVVRALTGPLQAVSTGSCAG